MAVTTPDKEKKPDVKPVNIMDSGWAKNSSGYDKVPAQPPVKNATAATTPQAAPAQPAAPTPPAQRPMAVSPAMPPSPPDQSPPDALSRQPSIPTSNAPEQNTANTLSQLSAGALPLLTISFLAASNVPFWREAHGLPPNEDAFSADARRLHENALTAGLIDNGFEAQRTSATRALPGENHSHAANEGEESRREAEKEKKRRLMSLLDLDTMQYDIRQTILDLDRTILQAVGIKDQLQKNLVEIRSEIKAVKAEIKTTEENIVNLQYEKKNGQRNVQYLVNSYHDLHAEYARKSEEDKAKFGTDDNGAVMSDPQDEILHQKAWDKNRDKVEKLYASKGLTEEFKTLEKLKKGEPVDQKEIEQAAAKIKAQNLPETLDQAMLKVDRQNEFFKTTSGLRVRIQENVNLIHQGNKFLDENEENLKNQINKLEKFKTRLGNLDVEEKDTLDKIAKVDGFIKAKQEQKERAEALEKKINDPAFREAYAAGKISKEEMTAITNEFSQLKKDIKNTDTELENFRVENRGSFKRSASSPTAPVTSTEASPLASSEKALVEMTRTTTPRGEPNSATASQSTSPREPAASGYSRTTTDSAAGLVEGSKMAKMDGALKQPFTEAARQPTGPAAAPTAEADQTMTIAAAEQQRRPSAAGMSV